MNRGDNSIVSWRDLFQLWVSQDSKHSYTAHTSTDALSDCTSQMASNWLTRSPGLTNQLTTRHSVIPARFKSASFELGILQSCVYLRLCLQGDTVSLHSGMEYCGRDADLEGCSQQNLLGTICLISMELSLGVENLIWVQRSSLGHQS